MDPSASTPGDQEGRRRSILAGLIPKRSLIEMAARISAIGVVAARIRNLRYPHPKYCPWQWRRPATIDECSYAQHLRCQLTRKKPMDRGPWAPRGRTQRDESIKIYAELGAVAILIRERSGDGVSPTLLSCCALAPDSPKPPPHSASSPHGPAAPKVSSHIGRRNQTLRSQ